MNAVHVRNQKHELTPPRNRDKPVTQQDALPRSEFQPRLLSGQDPLSLPRHPLCHPVQADCRSPCIDKVEALTIDSDTTTV
ncbi:hypothetical protein V6N12_006802 [Hibiscus sabdariffa]|uniref:Uncharacterized protein n=1 Tax=Hibiscus sabdariffa TaxID=183260 RepID=A0ABR2EZV6_9ROSI